MPRSQIVWGSLARAVRRPTRFDDDIRVSTPGGVLVVVGSGDFRAESLVAGEAGYRIQPSPLFAWTRPSLHTTSATCAVRTSRDGPAARRRQHARGGARGVEVGVNLQPAVWWRAHVGYTWLDDGRSAERREPRCGRRGRRPTIRISSSASARHSTSPIESSSTRCCAPSPRCRTPSVPAAELNVRAGWWVTTRAELWVAGQDLLHDRHPEFGADLPTRTEFERSIRVGITIRTPR